MVFLRLSRLGLWSAFAVLAGLVTLVTLVALASACAGAGGGVAAAPAADAPVAAAPAGADFLAATSFGADAEVHPDELTRHPRGFYFREVMLGTGTEALGGRTVRVSYVVRLADGREVDRAEPETPLTFRVGEADIIAALDAAVRGMRIGGTRQLVVPPRLAYGARGRGPVPPNAVLVMMVTLVGVQ